MGNTIDRSLNNLLIPLLVVKETTTGQRHLIGSNLNDSLIINDKGNIEFINTFNSKGTNSGDYKFESKFDGMFEEIPFITLEDFLKIPYTNDFRIPLIKIKDNYSPNKEIWLVGEFLHDSLINDNGNIAYINLQNMDGSPDGYRFISDKSNHIELCKLDVFLKRLK